MKRKEKISVIITVYNRFEYVRNALLSLLHQTMLPDEVIFADDGSKDDLGEYLEDLIKECPFKVKHVWQEDNGFRLARSRNNGVKAATGELLIFLDQDVILPDDFVEKVYEKRKKKRIVFVRGYLTSQDEKKQIFSFLDKENFNYDKILKIIYKKEVAKELKRIIFKDKLYRILYWLKLRSRGTKMVGMMFALYKDDFIAINGFDSLYKGWGQEDDDFGNRFYKYGGEVYPLELKNYLLHMYHSFSPTKKDSPNVKYYNKRKKEISKTNYQCMYGYINSSDEDSIVIKEYN